MGVRGASARSGLDGIRMWLDVGKKLSVDIENLRSLSVGDRIRAPGKGIVVDIDENAVVVARRNAQGRCMEVIFVGEAAKTLRSE